MGAEEINGGELIARILKEEGVEKVFGIIDGTYLGFNSGLKKNGIELITPRHESSAAHMAGAYARLTGKLGVCMASNGPGVANILPGVTVENAEGNRVLLITSCRRTQIAYPDRGGTYQYFDQVGTISPNAKMSALVPTFDRIPEMMRMAIRKCYEGRPGIVHIDVPENVMNTKVKTSGTVWKQGTFRALEPLEASEEQVKEAADMLLEAEKPMIHAGSGILHAQAFAELRELAEILYSPVTTSWAARGVLPEDHDLSIPMIFVQLNHIVRNDSDLVLTLGSRIGETDWWGKPPYWAPPTKQKMIQVDTDPMVLGANKPADLPVQSDAKAFLKKLIVELKRRNPVISTKSKSRIERYQKKKEKYRKKLDEALQDTSSPMNPAHAAHTVREMLPDDSILVADGGNTAVWANFYYKIKTPNTLLSTYKFGMLGAGISQALGACVAFPDRRVCCIIGDGAMGFHPQEIETAVRHGLKPIYLVLCDKQWGMVKMTQQIATKPLKTMIKKSLAPEELMWTELGEIQFDKLAESMGAFGQRVSDPKSLREAIRAALEANRCSVIHVDVNPVKHMWAPGLIHFKKMHQEPKGK